jgi:hypothetical protein
VRYIPNGLKIFDQWQGHDGMVRELYVDPTQSRSKSRRYIFGDHCAGGRMRLLKKMMERFHANVDNSDFSDTRGAVRQRATGR